MLAGDARAQRACTDFQRREMRAEQNRAAAARQRGLQMLFAFEARQLADALVGAPPADRRFEDADADAAEVLAQHRFALGGGSSGRHSSRLRRAMRTNESGSRASTSPMRRPSQTSNGKGSGSNTRRMPSASQVGQ